MASTPVTVFACGDVMTGRGVDQILPHPGDPALREPHAGDARDYVRMAERVSGPIQAPVDFGWPWGDALAVIDSMAPTARVINLETSVTSSATFAPGKPVHYRMTPANVMPFLPVALTLASAAVSDAQLVILGEGHPFVAVIAPRSSGNASTRWRNVGHAPPLSPGRPRCSIPLKVLRHLWLHRCCGTPGGHPGRTWIHSLWLSRLVALVTSTPACSSSRRAQRAIAAAMPPRAIRPGAWSRHSQDGRSRGDARGRSVP
jgi:hypothetical protein